MSFFLGLDAGGTNTECVLGDERQVLARAQGGSIKVMRVTPERAGETLRSLLDDVAKISGISLQQISATCAGIAGSRVPAVGNWLRASLGAMVAGQVLVCGDDAIALDAAFPGQAGVVVMAGTGSNIVGRTSTGEQVNVGGWGPVLDDEGSAFWIGHQALRRAVHAFDRGQPTLLLERVARHWQVAGLWEFVERAHATPPPDFAALAPIVNDCAEAGDSVCWQLLTEGGRLLAEAAVLAFHKMRALDAEDSPPAGIAFTGSILRSVPIVRESMIESIRSQLPAIPIVAEPVDPTAGALWRARSLGTEQAKEAPSS